MFMLCKTLREENVFRRAVKFLPKYLSSIYILFLRNITMPKVKKTSSVIHPNSRKASQLGRQVCHNEKLDRRKQEANYRKKVKLTKMKWFKENVDFTKDIYSAIDVKELIEKYLNRFQVTEKKDQTKMLKRHLSASTFQDYKSKFLVEVEKNEFQSYGLEIPNLMQKNAYDLFKAWNGDAQLLPAIETVKISKEQLECSVRNTSEKPS